MQSPGNIKWLGKYMEYEWDVNARGLTVGIKPYVSVILLYVFVLPRQ